MALPKKGLRNITVDGEQYAWSTTGRDGSIGLSIIPLKHQNRLITASFSYHSKVTDESASPTGDKIKAMKQQVIITGYIVRQTILYAIAEGWKLTGDTAVWNLGTMDEKVDLRIERPGLHP